MTPITIPNPVPGIHVTRTKIEPQPENERFYIHEPQNEGQWMNVVECGYKVIEPPHAPGEYWVREAYWLTNHGNTFKGTGIHYKDTDGKFISTRPSNRGKLCCWREAETMPQWASRYTATVSVAVERKGGEWWWVTTIEVKGK